MQKEKYRSARTSEGFCRVNQAVKWIGCVVGRLKSKCWEVLCVLMSTKYLIPKSAHLQFEWSSFIRRYSHENWRSLAVLHYKMLCRLRCPASCQLNRSADPQNMQPDSFSVSWCYTNRLHLLRWLHPSVPDLPASFQVLFGHILFLFPK